MLELTKELLKETIIMLVLLNVSYFLIPKGIRLVIKRATKIICRVLKGAFTLSKRVVLYCYGEYKNNKKTTLIKEQPNNVIQLKTKQKQA